MRQAYLMHQQLFLNTTFHTNLCWQQQQRSFLGHAVIVSVPVILDLLSTECSARAVHGHDALL